MDGYVTSPFSFFKKIFYFFIYLETGEGGEKERERNISRLPLATQARALTGNWTCNILVCGTVPNPLSHTGQGPTSIFNPNGLLAAALVIGYHGLLRIPKTASSSSESCWMDTPWKKAIKKTKKFAICVRISVELNPRGGTFRSKGMWVVIFILKIVPIYTSTNNAWECLFFPYPCK